MEIKATKQAASKGKAATTPKKEITKIAKLTRKLATKAMQQGKLGKFERSRLSPVNTAKKTGTIKGNELGSVVNRVWPK